MENVETVIDNADNKKAPFYSYRGVGKCLSAGVSFLTDNFIFILKVFSPIFAIGAIFYSIYLYNSQNIETSSSIFATISLFVTLFVFAIEVAMLFRLYLQDSLNKGFLGYNTLSLIKASRKLILRSLVILLIEYLLFLVAFIPTLISYFYVIKTNNFVLFAITILANLIVFFFVIGVPNVLAYPYALMSRGNIFKDLWMGFKRGYKYWGKCFGLVLLTGLIIFVILVLFFVPVGILLGFKKSSEISISMGDIVNIPVWFDTIMYVVLYISSFVACFLELFFVSPFAYLYASVKVDEKQSEATLKIDEIV
ncbi:MAG: hypothetical protein K6E54_07390 [Bacteroidaceae bacterium]|nr:hypothetical protein [Bacteroidaceae bacterium]